MCGCVTLAAARDSSIKRARVGVVEQVPSDDLQCHEARETQIQGAVDDAHAALAELRLDPVAGELLPDLRQHQRAAVAHAR